MKSILAVILFACTSFPVLSFVLPARVSQDQELERELAQEEQAEQAKSEIRKQFMRGKLVSNQKIVEGLSLKDFALISEAQKTSRQSSKGNTGLSSIHRNTNSIAATWKPLPSGCRMQPNAKKSKPHAPLF